jgi:amino acid permease
VIVARKGEELVKGSQVDNRSFNRPAEVPHGVALSRDLGLFTITMIGVGGMIGAGVFVLTGIAAGVAGPALGWAARRVSWPGG